MSPAQRVRFALAAERRRGTPFEEAGERALAGAEREDWTTALSWSREEWRAAYERRASRFAALSPLEREGGGVKVLA